MLLLPPPASVLVIKPGLLVMPLDRVFSMLHSYNSNSSSNNNSNSSNSSILTSKPMAWEANGRRAPVVRVKPAYVTCGSTTWKTRWLYFANSSRIILMLPWLAATPHFHPYFDSYYFFT